MTSNQLQWAAISTAVAVGLGLLVYDTRNKKVKKTEATNVKMKIEELWHYPIKGLSGIRIDSGTIGPQGFLDDRTFCLQKIHRDPATQEITFRETMYSGFHMQMILFKQVLEDSKSIIVTHTGSENPQPKDLNRTNSKYQIRIPLRPDISLLEKFNLDMHGSATDAYDMGSHISEWFSTYLGFETRLVYLGPHGRAVLGSGAPNTASGLFHKFLPTSWTQGDTITFQDFGQYLIVTTESNAEVTSRLADGSEMDITKFRPNIIVSGSPGAYDEDYWARLVFPGGVEMDMGAMCWRCQAITVDYETGRAAEGEQGQVWKKLMKDRRVDEGWRYGPVFGRYGFVGRGNWGKRIGVGEEVVLTRRERERPVFDWPLPKFVVDVFKN